MCVHCSSFSLRGSLLMHKFLHKLFISARHNDEETLIWEERNENRNLVGLIDFAFVKQSLSCAVMESDKLVEIPPSAWTELRDVYLLNWPDNHVAWHTINNYINWFRMDSNIKHLKIYSLNGSWRSDGTYAIVVSWKFLDWSVKSFD